MEIVRKKMEVRSVGRFKGRPFLSSTHAGINIPRVLCKPGKPRLTRSAQDSSDGTNARSV